MFGAKRRTRGLRFVADDVDWSWGSGPTVHGPGEALFMAMLGRADALRDLRGDGSEAFATRLGSRATTR